MLTGKCAVITGANRGIGRAILEVFAKNKAFIFACARKKNPEFEQEMRVLEEETGCKVVEIYFDLTDAEGMKEAVKEIRSYKRDIDILVNNAGVLSAYRNFSMMPIQEVRQTFEVDFFAQMEFTQYIARLMQRKRKGSIVYISSIASLDGFFSSYDYVACKAAVNAAMKQQARELGQCGIRVNAVAPGIVRTDMIKDSNEENLESILDAVMLKRFGTAEEIANAVLFLGSDMASYITGQVLRVDGGNESSEVSLVGRYMQREELVKIAQTIRKDILTMALHSGTKGAHIGGGMSCADILAVLYGSIMKYDVSDPEWDGRDRFIMSKAHSAIALYAALRYAGFLSEKEINDALQGRAYLYKHPRMDISHGFEFSGGSLGQGLALAAGSAVALERRNNKDAKFYVLIGDGECDEGSIWEAASFICHYHLKNVVPIIDLNHLQNDGNTEDVMDLGNMADRWRSMGYDVIEVNGHDVMELQAAFLQETEKPKAIIAHTIKGKGVSFAENNVDWHISYLTKEMYEQVIGEWNCAGDK